MARMKFMVCGVSGSGKSASLRNLKPANGVLYLNAEASKKLPFAESKDFVEPKKALKAKEFLQAIAQAESMPHIHTIVIDTVSFLMDMFESQEVLTATNTQMALTPGAFC